MSSSPKSPAKQILADYLAKLEAGGEVDLEVLLAEHPEHADELRKLHSQWLGASDLMRNLDTPGDSGVTAETQGEPARVLGPRSKV